MSASQTSVIVPDAEGSILSEEPSGREEDAGPATKATNASARVRTGGFWMSTPQFTHADYHLLCPDGDLEHLLLERTAENTLAARRFFKCVVERVLPLGGDVEINGALVVYLTTQESLDGIREKATRIASFDELEASSESLRL